MNAITRRQFVKTSAQSSLAAAVALPFLSAASQGRTQGASERVVLGLIGAGGRGSGLAANFLQIPQVEFKYICDASLPRAQAFAGEIAKKQNTPPQAVQDMRRVFEDRDVQGVVIATPEQWHALATIWACQSGKDVYVEKNPSLCIREGQKMMEAAKKYNRVVQVGFQNRSGPYAVTARDYLRSGKLGKVVLVKVYNLLDGGGWSAQPNGQPPAGLDWDRWLGPAPSVPYNAGRHQGWGDWWDYCGGPFSGDASHQLDLTRMVLGDPAHPKAVSCTGGRLAFPDSREMPDLMAITYDYGDFVMTCESGNFAPYMKKFPQEVRYGDQWPYWPQSSCRVEIYGTKQLMYLGRHGCGWQVMEAGGKVVAQDKGYFPDKWHQPNFIDCIRTRRQPNASIDVCHASACLIHLGVAAYRTGNQRLAFDAQKEVFVGNEAANKFVQLPQRAPYQIPANV
jgi:predicted dehydrogenase